MCNKVGKIYFEETWEIVLQTRITKYAQMTKHTFSISEHFSSRLGRGVEALDFEHCTNRLRRCARFLYSEGTRRRPCPDHARLREHGDK